MPLYPGNSLERAIPQCSGTHLFARLVQHATLSESGPIRAFLYKTHIQDNTLVTYSGTLETPILRRPAF
jgi:hypothetical protein